MPTSENAFHAYKILYSSLDENKRIEYLTKLTKATASQSKVLGRSINIDTAKWDANSYGHMLTVVRAKFDHDSKLADRLLATGDIELVEDNQHGDRLWGRVNGTGKNQLGEILTIVRNELKVGLPDGLFRLL